MGIHHVAIAGGSGGLGRTLTCELCKDEEIHVYVLSRKSKPPLDLASNARWLEAPYDNIDELSKLLDSNSIDTVISTLTPSAPEVFLAQDNLILAASQSASVNRFIPSEWGIDSSLNDEHLPLSFKTAKLSSLALLRQQRSRLSHTVVYNGYFMDYFGMPHCPSSMLPETPFIDIAARKAAIPGSGHEPVSWTYTQDVAKYVRELVRSEDPWPAETLIEGDKVSLNEVLAIAEQARGGVKFDVVHDSLDALRKGKISEIPAYVALYDTFPKAVLLEWMAAFGVGIVTGVFDLGGDLLNDRYKEIQPVKMRDFIWMCWEGR
ncbi:MAG: hypothetical protein Q9195_002698 [Heterodermia aff. obscurata]